MRLTTREAAKKLGMTPAGILYLINEKKLQATRSGKGSGKGRGYVLNSRDVREYGELRKHGLVRKPQLLSLLPIPIQPKGTKIKSNGIISRLEAIERKLDDLARLWS
jgi:hypothetical protein